MSIALFTFVTWVRNILVSGGGYPLVLTKRIAVAADKIVLGNIDDISCVMTTTCLPDLPASLFSSQDLLSLMEIIPTTM